MQPDVLYDLALMDLVQGYDAASELRRESEAARAAEAVDDPDADDDQGPCGGRPWGSWRWCYS
jgi:hypothetical protein